MAGHLSSYFPLSLSFLIFKMGIILFIIYILYIYNIYIYYIYKQLLHCLPVRKLKVPSIYAGLIPCVHNQGSRDGKWTKAWSFREGT